jgi:hypothetical protein
MKKLLHILPWFLLKQTVEYIYGVQYLGAEYVLKVEWPLRSTVLKGYYPLAAAPGTHQECEFSPGETLAK